MSGLVALGAGIAALTGIGGGIGIGIASRRLPVRSRPTCCWALLWQKVLQFSASSLHC